MGVKVSKLVVPLVRINRLLTSLASAELLNVHLLGKKEKNLGTIQLPTKKILNRILLQSGLAE